jgi:hypothetical protein
MDMTVFFDVAPYSHVGIYYPDYGDRSTSGKSLNFYETIRRNIPEDSQLHFMYHLTGKKDLLLCSPTLFTKLVKMHKEDPEALSKAAVNKYRYFHRPLTCFKGSECQPDRNNSTTTSHVMLHNLCN